MYLINPTSLQSRKFGFNNAITPSFGLKSTKKTLHQRQTQRGLAKPPKIKPICEAKFLKILLQKKNKLSVLLRLLIRKRLRLYSEANVSKPMDRIRFNNFKNTLLPMTRKKINHANY